MGAEDDITDRKWKVFTFTLGPGASADRESVCFRGGNGECLPDVSILVIEAVFDCPSAQSELVEPALRLLEKGESLPGLRYTSIGLCGASVSGGRR